MFELFSVSSEGGKRSEVEWVAGRRGRCDQVPSSAQTVVECGIRRTKTPTVFMTYLAYLPLVGYRSNLTGNLAPGAASALGHLVRTAPVLFNSRV